ncbi:hypothetical protein AV274_2071 [Blastocystis sp. ATCC 50177/Nand II]|uniref:Uncharacterized protein n=1 Tax=Blastocystis sp. subtype 1 (strain ATCC 50177 / NandII) TaxID=478820 RepID=A0A196SGR1_BLAHN|nr:hypothetical protein AV274_2071 [Blastocystis sp. ATCC 50177/Nand II]
MDDYSSTLQILRNNGYTEDVDARSMPLIAHMLSDIQRQRIEILTHNASKTDNEERAKYLGNELKEAARRRNQAGMKENTDLRKENERLQRELAEKSNRLQSITRDFEQSRRDYTALKASLQSQKDERLQIVNIQAINRSLQSELQDLRASSAKSRQNEETLSFKLAECQHNLDLANDSLRVEQTKNLSQRDEVSRLSTLLQIQKDSTRSLEASLKQEKALTYQLQLRGEAYERTVSDLEQRLRTERAKGEALQKQAKEAQDREQATYKELEEKKRAYDALLVEQMSARGVKERLETENKSQKEELTRLRITQEELDKKVRELQVEETERLRSNGKMQSELEEKKKCLREMEQMLNTERTRSLVEVSQLRELLMKQKKNSRMMEATDAKQEANPLETPQSNHRRDGSFPSIDATPIKVVPSPFSDMRTTTPKSDPVSATPKSDPVSAEKPNATVDTSSTSLSNIITNLSNVMSELEQQLGTKGK